MADREVQSANQFSSNCQFSIESEFLNHFGRRGTEDRPTRQLGTANGDLFDTGSDGQGIHDDNELIEGHLRFNVIVEMWYLGSVIR